MAKKYRRAKKRRKNSDSSWKKLKRHFRLKKRMRRFGLVLLVFSSALLTLGAVYVWHYLAQPFASAAGELEKTAPWDGRRPLNVLWLEAETEEETSPLASIAVVSLNPTSNRLAVFTLPLDYQINLPSQGDQQLRSIYGAGNLLEARLGVKLSAKSASYLLGLPVSSYLLMSTSGVIQLTAGLAGDGIGDYFSISNITRLPASLLAARKYLRTDLSLGELVRFVYFLCRVRSDRLATIDFDGNTLADPGAVDRAVSPFLRDENLVAERLKIQILNGTTKPGLASFVARIVQNMGGDVIRVGNYDRQDLTKGFLILSESGSYTAQRLAYALGVADSHPPKSSVEKRADITIVLGLEDYERIF